MSKSFFTEELFSNKLAFTAYYYKEADRPPDASYFFLKGTVYHK